MALWYLGLIDSQSFRSNRVSADIDREMTFHMAERADDSHCGRHVGTSARDMKRKPALRQHRRPAGTHA